MTYFDLNPLSPNGAQVIHNSSPPPSVLGWFLQFHPGVANLHTQKITCGETQTIPESFNILSISQLANVVSNHLV